jgi:uncharacterized damage-inducible protein DinB
MSTIQNEQEEYSEKESEIVQLEQDFINSNVWADEKVIEIIEKLPENLYYKDVGFTIGSLHAKVAHLVSIMKFFKLVFDNQTPSKFPDLSGLTREELVVLWKELNKYYTERINNKPNGKEQLTLLYNIKEEFDVKNIYFDIYTHSAYHRGQVMTILRLLEQKTLNTDYLTWYFTQKIPKF